MRKGDRVISVENINVGLFGNLRKGTTGYVVDVYNGFFSNSVTVKFDTGDLIKDINPAFLRRY